MGHVVCLFDENGISGHDWAEVGHTVFCYDIEHKAVRFERVGFGMKVFLPWDVTQPNAFLDVVDRHAGKTVMSMAFPPCDDLTVAGAAWFAKKREKDPLFQTKAMKMVLNADIICTALEAPYFIENPVGVLSTKWRKPDHIFNPYEFGGYLPEDDVHPLYPEYIVSRDAYPKKTCLWVGCGFTLPAKKPVPTQEGYSLQHTKLGGKSKRTKRIRSATPRGFARAVFERFSHGIYS